MPPLFGFGFGIIRQYTPTGGVVPPPHPGEDFLLEDGSFFLLEDGTSTLLLEA